MKVADVMARLDVSKDTVIAWITSGQLHATNVAADPNARRKSYRISEADLVAFVAARRMRVEPTTTRKRPARRPTPRVWIGG